MTENPTVIKKSPIYYLWFILTVVFSVGIDQITKYLAVKYLMPIGTFPIIEDVLHLTYVENTGAAFGMMKDSRWVFMTVSTVAILAIVYVLYKYGLEMPFASFCLSMILGGGIGNMIDRIALGYVVDFVDFRLINFAVFNGADSFVCVGAFLLVIYLFRDIAKESKAAKNKAEAAAVSASEEAETENGDEENGTEEEKEEKND